VKLNFILRYLRKVLVLKHSLTPEPMPFTQQFLAAQIIFVADYTINKANNV